MKSSLVIAAFVAFLSSSPARAEGSCDTLFNQIQSWLAGDSHLIRMVTTLTSNEDKVTYTRGYLSESDDIAGLYEVNSAFYVNDGAPDNPFKQKDAGGQLTLAKVGPDAAQLNVLPLGGASKGYLVRCVDGLLTSVTSDGILAVSFRYSSPN